MNWADYREKLGIGFNDDAKFEALKNKFVNFVRNIKCSNYTKGDCFSYFIMVGEVWIDNPYSSSQLSYSFEKCKCIEDVVSKAVALYNSFEIDNSFCNRKECKDEILLFIKKCFKDLNLLIEIYSDDDGIFIFPKGVPEFDEELVSKPLDWLRDLLVGK